MKSSVLIGDTRHALTPWLPGTTNPAHQGVYAVDVTDAESAAVADVGADHAEPLAYACWDGKAWHRPAESPAEAALAPRSSMLPLWRWRGLTEASDAPCATCGGHTVVDAGVAVNGDIDLISECPDC